MYLSCSSGNDPFCNLLKNLRHPEGGRFKQNLYYVTINSVVKTGRNTHFSFQGLHQEKYKIIVLHFLFVDRIRS